MYQSIVLPVIDYCDVAWSNIGTKISDKLDRAQRRAAKIVLKTRDADAEKNLKWLPLSIRRDMHTVYSTFKCLKGPAPVFLKDYFTVSQSRYNTRRNGTDLVLPRVRTEIAKRSFYFNGAKLFNGLPLQIKECSSIVLFKDTILSYFSDRY